jgi:hypothetical protein
MRRLEKNLSRSKLIASSIILIVVLSFVSILSTTQNVSALPVHRDVLLVSLGTDEAPTKTSEIIEGFLNELEEGIIDSGSDDIDLDWMSNSLVSESIRCTQSIVQETQKSKLMTGIVQTSLSSFDNDISRFRASVIIVVGHGSESGIADETDSDNLMPWSDVITSTAKVQPQLTILASCFSSDAVSIGPNIIGFNGVVDALLVGHVVSLLLTQVIPDTPSFVFEETLYTAMRRSEEIMLDETKLLPLSIQSDWAAIRIPVITILTGFFFIAAYYTIWAVQGVLASILGAIAIGATGLVIGALFQVALEVIRTMVGNPLKAINYDMGRIFNASIGAILGFIISYGTSFLLPSFISAIAYILTGTTAALVLANTPLPWIRAAACLSAAIGLISIIDMFIQLL